MVQSVTRATVWKQMACKANQHFEGRSGVRACREAGGVWRLGHDGGSNASSKEDSAGEELLTPS